jgi:hypothetical protein
LALAIPEAASAQDTVTVFGLKHYPVGNATLNVNGSGQLEVSNIGSSGDDGVMVLLPPGVVRWDMKTLDLGDAGNPGNPIPDGAHVRLTSLGSIDGIPDQIITVAHYEDTGSAVYATMDFSALEPCSLVARFYDGASLVAVGSTDLDSLGVFTCSWWPDSWDVSWVDVSAGWEVGPVIITATVGIHMWKKSGSPPISADLIEVYAMCVDRFDGYSAMMVTAKDIPTLTITDEILEKRARVPASSEWGLILLAILLLGAGGFYIWFRRQRATATA